MVPDYLGDQKNPAYQIDPNTEPIMINLTNLNSTLFPVKVNPLVNPASRYPVDGYQRLYANSMVIRFPWPIRLYAVHRRENTVSQAPPFRFIDNISLMIDPYNFSIMSGRLFPNVYFNLTFDLKNSASPRKPYNSSFLNNTLSSPFDYNYNGANVTQPQLDDAVVEVAAW